MSVLTAELQVRLRYPACSPQALVVLRVTSRGRALLSPEFAHRIPLGLFQRV
jgi:hypothetical protein